jgi:RND family efflux transporter MFP subunit
MLSLTATPSRNLSAGVLAVVSIAAAGCSRTAAANGKSPVPPAVAVVKVERRAMYQDAVLEAELEPFQEVDVRAKVAGYVHGIFVDIGSHVKRGDLLATLTVPELESDRDQAAAAVQRREAEVIRAEQQLKLAQAASQLAELTYNRLSAVDKSHPGLIAMQELDTALDREQEAYAQVSAGQAALGAAKAALTEAVGNQKQVQAMVDYARIKAPFDGVISRRYVHTGAMVPAGTTTTVQGTPIVRISQLDPLRLVVYIPASLAPRVHVATPLTVQFSGAGALTVPIARIADAVDTASRTMRAEADVPNRDLKLLPGEYAKAALHVQHDEAALAIPLEAIVRNGDQASVWVVDSRRRLESRRVTLGIESSGKVQAVSGLSENELVVVGRNNALQPGEEVRPKAAAMAAFEGGQ